MRKRSMGMLVAGACAGAVNGLFGAGGGMVLVPLLGMMAQMDDTELFPSSISIILPICLVSLSFTALTEGLNLPAALPYLIGSAVGGFLAGVYGQKVPAVWLHRGLGILILWGGIRYLC